MKVFGIQLVLSTSELSLWWDNDEHHPGDGKPGWGIVIKLRGGDVVRPLGHPRDWLRKDAPNVWFSPDPAARWKVWRFYCPLPVLPFVSIALGRYGFYAGFKDFRVLHPEYRYWLPEQEVVEGSLALTPSVSWRRTRVH